MSAKVDITDGISNGATSLTLVSWSEKYAVGIEMIDSQHMELVRLTNELYQACTASDMALGTVFKNTMSRMVEYVRLHFATEMALLERVKYPECKSHKEQHDLLTMNILNAAKDHKEGKKFVPNNFVRTLRDWIFGHIAIYDQAYAAYVREQKKKGLLTDRQING